MATVQQRGSGYLIRVSCGYDINGKQITRSKTWTPDPGMTARQVKKELDRQAVLFEEQCRTGQALDGNIRLSDFAERWFDEYASIHLKANTIALYSHLWQRIKPALGHLRLNKIQAHHLNAFYLNLLEDGIRDDTLFRCDDFKAELKKRQITGIELSERTGLGIRTIYEINRGGCVKPETADKICAALGCKTSDLFQPSKAVQCLSTNTANHYHKFLSTLFRSAVKQNLIVENPCQRADPPRPEDHEPVFLDEDQAVKMIEALEREPMQYRVMIFLLLDSGMRRGELLGLEWKDIDFEKSTVCIRRNSVYLPQKGIFTETPKTQKSIRTIKLPSESMDMLRQYRTWQLQKRLQLGDQWKDYDRLFTKWNGMPMHPSTATGWFSDFAKRVGLPDGISIHSLRHTNATLLIAAGTNIRTVSARLGHAQTSTTTDIYAHAIQSADAAAAEAIGSIVHRKKRRKA